MDPLPKFATPLLSQSAKIYVRLFFAYTITVPVRSCLVSFTDSEGIENGDISRSLGG
jgi:hypothetical protein